LAQARLRKADQSSEKQICFSEPGYEKQIRAPKSRSAYRSLASARLRKACQSSEKQICFSEPGIGQATKSRSELRKADPFFEPGLSQAKKNRSELQKADLLFVAWPMPSHEKQIRAPNSRSSFRSLALARLRKADQSSEKQM